ncbi:MAG: hypothetical protein ACTSU5_09950 [Promethearchaeota archaeon]
MYKEVISDGLNSGYEDAILLKNLHEMGKIVTVKTRRVDPVLKGYLHAGEYESILVAQDLGAIIVIDEKKGRIIAEERGIEYLSTADVILILLREKFINYDLFRSNLGKYSARGWISPVLIEKYLLEAKKYE